jgi:hypothetical protein
MIRRAKHDKAVKYINDYPDQRALTWRFIIGVALALVVAVLSVVFYYFLCA